jgi:hypothetical protein
MADLKDPEVNSEFATSKKLAAEKGTAPGIDPVTGERAAVTYRQLFNETGDERVAKEIFENVAKAGGFGNVDLDQALDIRSLDRSAKAHKESAKSGVDFKTGGELDRFGKRHHEQAAQHQDNLVNAVGEALDRLRKG